MIIWRNKKDNRLYLIYELYGKAVGFGGYEAEPYGWSGKIIKRANIKNFIAVGIR